jgi:hypothetical protein
MVSDRFSSFDCFLSSDSGFEDLVVKEVRDDSIGELCVIFQMLEMNHVLMWMLGSAVICLNLPKNLIRYKAPR